MGRPGKANRSAPAGVFVTFEGIEGAGKSTQMRMAAEELANRGFSVLQTREPGGTRIGERLRALLLSPEHGDMHPLTELFLYEACRAQLVSECVRPALEQGRIVLCDRFTDATAAYQGFGRGLGLELVERLNGIAAQGLVPDLTVLLDCPVDEGLRRVRTRYREAAARGWPGGGLDRFEAERKAFHQRIREGYLRLAERHGDRIRVVDACGDAETVHGEVMDRLVEILKEQREYAL